MYRRQCVASALALLIVPATVLAQRGRGRGAGEPPPVPIVLHAAHVFDGTAMQSNWDVVVTGNKITAAGPAASVTRPAGAKVMDLGQATLMPGMIEGHSHLLLHPYNETSWNDQVLNEPLALRIARATVSARTTLMAGITTTRDLGTEGAGYADVGLRDAINQGIIPGPRILASTRAIVATGDYGVKGAPEWDLPYGGQQASGNDVIAVTRDQISRGADWVKIYADYRYGSLPGAHPTFTVDEIKLITTTAHNEGHPVTAHATSAEGMTNAILGGVNTIEHGDDGTPEVFRMMAEKGIALCPTVAAGDATAQYAGWRKGTDPEPARIAAKRETFRQALAAHVKIIFGGDVGVFSHGDNVRELDIMVNYGMSALDAVTAATSGNAANLLLPDRGSVKTGLLADLIVVDGDPTTNIGVLHNVKFVMKNGEIVKQ
ncbi:MAG TPA: amidohydrolase family protein [Gemmatimonadales bacterium]|jgi:imidazolonepropionase-like amidohydrolase